MLLRRQAEAARSGEIKRAGIAGQFADNESEIAAAQAFFQRKQGILGRGSGHVDQAMVQVCRKAGKVGSPRQTQRSLVLHPEKRALIGHGASRLLAKEIASKRKRHPRSASVASRREQFGVKAIQRHSRMPARRSC